MAPDGSSIERASSRTSTSNGVAMPATTPMKSAAAGETRVEHAVDATRPDIQPLAQRLASGLPKRMLVTANVAAMAAEPHSKVLIAVLGKVAGVAFSHRIAPARFQARNPTRHTMQPKRT